MDTTELAPLGFASLSASPPARRLVAAFLSGRKATTLAAYSQDLEGFRAFVRAPSVEAAAGELLARGHGEANALALSYRAHLVDREFSSATVNRRLAALRSLVKLARTLGFIPWTLEVEGLKGQSYRDTRGPNHDDVRRLADHLEKRKDAKGLRDRAIVRLLHGTALRRGEVVSLDLEHVDLVAGTISILGKARMDREKITLPLAEKAALAAWLEVRGSAPGPLFFSLDAATKGHRLTGRAVHILVKTLGDELGLHLRPHGLRHAAITRALDLTGGDVRRVQRFSRHRDLRVLTTYDDNRTDLAGEVARLVSTSV